jgi:hypothetical protein
MAAMVHSANMIRAIQIAAVRHAGIIVLTVLQQVMLHAQHAKSVRRAAMKNAHLAQRLALTPMLALLRKVVITTTHVAKHALVLLAKAASTATLVVKHAQRLVQRAKAVLAAIHAVTRLAHQAMPVRRAPKAAQIHVRPKAVLRKTVAILIAHHVAMLAAARHALQASHAAINNRAAMKTPLLQRYLHQSSALAVVITKRI